MMFTIIIEAFFANKWFVYLSRYLVLASSAMEGAPTDKDAASICFQSIELEEDKYRLGHTKLFFRTGVIALLEELRESKIQQMMCSIQVRKFQRQLSCCSKYVLGSMSDLLVQEAIQKTC